MQLLVKNINGDDNSTGGGDNHYVFSAIKGLFRDKNRQKCNLRFTQRGNPNEKMGLIAGGTRCGNYIKKDNNSLCMELRLQQDIMAVLLGD